MGKRAKVLEPHINSLEANVSAEELEVIMYGRVTADEDLRQLEVWASSGFVSGQSLDNPEEVI